MLRAFGLSLSLLVQLQFLGPLLPKRPLSLFQRSQLTKLSFIEVRPPLLTLIVLHIFHISLQALTTQVSRSVYSENSLVFLAWVSAPLKK